MSVPKREAPPPVNGSTTFSFRFSAARNRMFWIELLAHLCVFKKATLVTGEQSL